MYECLISPTPRQSEVRIQGNLKCRKSVSDLVQLFRQWYTFRISLSKCLHNKRTPKHIRHTTPKKKDMGSYFTVVIQIHHFKSPLSSRIFAQVNLAHDNSQLYPSHSHLNHFQTELWSEIHHTCQRLGHFWDRMFKNTEKLNQNKYRYIFDIGRQTLNLFL
jgi:hypothetical protein